MIFAHEHFQRDDKALMANMKSVTAAGTRRAIAAMTSKKRKRNSLEKKTESGSSHSASASVSLPQADAVVAAEPVPAVPMSQSPALPVATEKPAMQQQQPAAPDLTLSSLLSQASNANALAMLAPLALGAQTPSTSALDQLQAAMIPVMPSSAASNTTATGLQTQLDYLQTLALTSLLMNNTAPTVAAPAPAAPSSDISLLAQLLLQQQQQS